MKYSNAIGYNNISSHFKINKMLIFYTLKCCFVNNRGTQYRYKKQSLESDCLRFRKSSRNSNIS